MSASRWGWLINASANTPENDRDDHGTDTRCLVVDERAALTRLFDDGRDGALGLCACLEFTLIVSAQY